MKRNLYNVDYKGNTNTRKTKDVFAYVEKLKCPDHFSLTESCKFKEIKTEALDAITADAALDIIGYNVVGDDEIFSEAQKQSKGK